MALPTWNVRGPGNGIADPQRIAGKVCGHSLAEALDAPDSFMPQHYRQRNRQVAMVEMHIRSTHAGETNAGDDRPWTGLRQ